MPTVSIGSTLEMYYEIDDFTDPWREAETVVLHHGIVKNSRHWYAWPPLLARTYRVIRLDARGFGKSSVPPPGYPWSLSGFARDLRGLIDHLGLDKVHLVGETIGGCIGLQFAYEYPERLHSLTISGSPYTWAGREESVAKALQLIKTEGVAAWLNGWSALRFGEGLVDPAFADWYQREQCKTSRRVVLEMVATAGTVDLTSILPSIKVPTLILAGEKSQVVPLETNKKLQQLLPNATLVVFPGAPNHVYAIMPEPCVKEWLRFVSALKK